jgi:hypothetical protein
MKEYFIDPDPYYTPRISIGPFSLKDTVINDPYKNTDSLRYLGSNLVYTNSGKDAIRLALDYLQLKSKDVVGIVTTSRNSYVSKCVTETISEYCAWSMYEVGSEVDVLFIIHEFGTLLPLTSMQLFREMGIPIINDFAYSLLTLIMNEREDFCKEINISSFPKSFNVNFGGVLGVPSLIEEPEVNFHSKAILERIPLDLSTAAIHENINKRKLNRAYYKEELSSYGYKVVWDEEDVCPGVCMIEPSRSTNLQRLKTFLQRNGIESSVFYGQEKFFVPVHQLMTLNELEYVCFMIKAYKDEN